MQVSVSGGELGPTLKLKRFFVHQKYKEVIDAMYDENGEENENGNGHNGNSQK